MNRRLQNTMTAPPYDDCERGREVLEDNFSDEHSNSDMASMISASDFCGSMTSTLTMESGWSTGTGSTWSGYDSVPSVTADAHCVTPSPRQQVIRSNNQNFHNRSFSEGSIFSFSSRSSGTSDCEKSPADDHESSTIISQRLGIARPNYGNSIKMDEKINKKNGCNTALQKDCIVSTMTTSFPSTIQKSDATMVSSEEGGNISERDDFMFSSKRNSGVVSASSRSTMSTTRSLRRRNRNRDRYGKDRRLRNMLLLLQPSTKTFELIRVDGSSTEEIMKALGPDYEGLHEEEEHGILIAVPDGYAPDECLRLSEPILRHPDVVARLQNNY